jgi:hypothetical protein
LRLLAALVAADAAESTLALAAEAALAALADATEYADEIERVAASLHLNASLAMLTAVRETSEMAESTLLRASATLVEAAS